MGEGCQIFYAEVNTRLTFRMNEMLYRFSFYTLRAGVIVSGPLARS